MDTINLVQEPLIVEIWQGNDWTVVSAGAPEDIIDGGISFLTLSDTPDTYKNQAGKTPVVNAEEDGLIFKTIVPAKFTGLSDCPSSYKNAANKFVRVKSDHSGLEFVNVAEGEVEDFTQLADVPGTYETFSGQVVRVNESENGLEFVPAEKTLPEHFDEKLEFTYPRLTVNKYGIITEIESQEAGTVLPSFEENHILVGDGSNIPVALPNGQDDSVLKCEGGVPSFSFLHTLKSSSGRIQFTILEDESVDTYMEVVETLDSVSTIACSSNTTNNVNLNLYAQNGGVINLGQGYNTVSLNVDTSVKKFVAVEGVNTITLVPRETGTIRIDPIYTSSYSYTNNVIDDNDLANKGYVDKAIAEAVSGSSRTLSISSPITITPTFSQQEVGTGIVGKILDEIKIAVTENFDTNAYITIGDDVDNDYLSDGPIYLNGGVELITIPCLTPIVRSSIKVYLVSSGATVGSATMVVKWM